jgi:hypothetical protein
VCAVLALSLVWGCSAGWERVELPSDTMLAPRQNVQVWHGSQPRVFHAVRVTADSLVGVPFQKHPSCDSCRIAMARSEVDSLRLGDPESAGIASWAVPIGIVFGVVSIWVARFPKD